MNKIIAWVAGSMGFMMVGFALFLNGNDKGNLPFMLSGGVLILGGLFIWVLAVNRAEKADERADKRREEQMQTQEKQMQTLVQTFVQTQEKLMRTFARELKGFREDIGSRGKRIKTRPRKGGKSNGDN